MKIHSLLCFLLISACGKEAEQSRVTEKEMAELMARLRPETDAANQRLEQEESNREQLAALRKSKEDGVKLKREKLASLEKALSQVPPGGSSGELETEIAKCRKELKVAEEELAADKAWGDAANK